MPHNAHGGMNLLLLDEYVLDSHLTVPTHLFPISHIHFHSSCAMVTVSVNVRERSQLGNHGSG